MIGDWAGMQGDITADEVAESRHLATRQRLHRQPPLAGLLDHSRWVRFAIPGDCNAGGPYAVAEAINIYTREPMWYVLDRDGHAVFQFSGGAGRRLAEFQVETLP